LPQRDAQKQKTRRQIVAAAARLIRERGPAAVRVADVMWATGLTHGGFYAHFGSREALLAEALASATAYREHWLNIAGATNEADWVAGIARRYLSTTHRRQPGAGCPYPEALAETSRAGGALRESLQVELRHTFDRMQEGLGDAPNGMSADARARSLLALFVGAMQLARAFDDDAEADAILDAARAFAAPATPHATNHAGTGD
tara:strand:+ start:2949 stop:3557 length:609 start_codon:yes stop_codon:yes gene_type:complete